MKRGKVARAVITFAIGMSIGFGVLSAHAQWSESNRAAALADCLPSCEKAAGPSTRDLCTRYCECSVTEAEARFPRFDGLDRATRDGNPEIIEAIKQIARICAQRASGR